jgi:sodium/potassium-transporting ATPase subunit alpha
LSIHVETLEQAKSKASTNKPVDPALAIRQINVHLASPDDVLNRFSTSLTYGLESDAIQRRLKNGSNVISAPPTQYWKKILNYVFGGFNFLMWIAFIVTIVRFFPPALQT